MLLRRNFLLGRGTRKTPLPLTRAALEKRQRLILGWVSLLFALLLWAILAVQPPTNPALQPGKPSPVNIQAHSTIDYVSQWRTERERARAESAADTVVYVRDLSTLTQQRAALADLLSAIMQIRNDPTLRKAQEQEKLTSLPNSTLVISPELAIQISHLSDEQWAELQRQSLDLYDRAVSEYNYALDEQSVIRLRSFSLPYWTSLIAKDTERDMLILLSGSFLKANLVIDEEATRIRKEEARAGVSPVTVQIFEGESIVRIGDLVTPDIQEKLEALGELNLGTDWYAVGGKGLLAALVAIVFGSYLRITQREIWIDTRVLLTIIAVCLLTTLLARLASPLGANWLYLFPLSMTALLLAGLFNTGLALTSGLLLTLLVTIIGNGNIALGTSLLLGLMAGVFTIGRAERTLKFLMAGLAVAVTTALASAAFVLVDFDTIPVEQLLLIAMLSLINGALSAILALGLYNIIGHVAGVVTPLQLMELAHPAQPLLRKLIREAPGTYYHSVSVGNLAESAAEAIGADALLLRVASYYHDIGKTIRPYFFTDNQSDRENVHNDLDPLTSAGIIADHVREGEAMARAAGLPRQIIEFIPTHHGTSVIRHFYQLALQQQDGVKIEDFSYPGPRPRTREQAIMMLADSVEATVRSKVQNGKIITAREERGSSGRTPGDGQTIEELVSSIIDERIRSNQLDESQLTLQDISRIRQAFVTTLQGIYHPRVDYAPQIVKT